MRPGFNNFCPCLGAWCRTLNSSRWFVNSFLAPLFLLKQQQAACSDPLKKGRKTFTSGLNVCGKWCFVLRQMKDFVYQVLTLTMMATAKAHVSYLLIKSHSSGALAASLREWSTKKATALKSGIESGTCLACLWKKGGKRKRSMFMRLLNEAAEWGCYAHLASSKHSTLS